MQSGDSLYPLTLGNIWEYEYKKYRNGVLKSKGEIKYEVIEEGEIFLENQKFTKIGIERIGLTNNIPIPYSVVYYYLDHTGLYAYAYKMYDEITVYDRKQQMLHYPLSL